MSPTGKKRIRSQTLKYHWCSLFLPETKSRVSGRTTALEFQSLFFALDIRFLLLTANAKSKHLFILHEGSDPNSNVMLPCCLRISIGHASRRIYQNHYHGALTVKYIITPCTEDLFQMNNANCITHILHSL